MALREREQILENVSPRVGNPPQVDVLELVAAGDPVVILFVLVCALLFVGTALS